jgi:hypothetical protein
LVCSHVSVWLVKAFDHRLKIMRSSIVSFGSEHQVHSCRCVVSLLLCPAGRKLLSRRKDLPRHSAAVSASGLKYDNLYTVPSSKGTVGFLYTFKGLHDCGGCGYMYTYPFFRNVSHFHCHAFPLLWSRLSQHVQIFESILFR